MAKRGSSSNKQTKSLTYIVPRFVISISQQRQSKIRWAGRKAKRLSGLKTTKAIITYLTIVIVIRRGE